MSYRTLKLNHHEIALIQNALGIAEAQYTKMHEQAAKLAIVRGNESNRYDQQHAGNYLHEISTKFADLNDRIQNGEKDV